MAETQTQSQAQTAPGAQGLAGEPSSARARTTPGLTAAQARQALARGAMAWDLRSSGDLLPGAVRVPEAALQAWLLDDDLPALAAAVSAAGLNLAREVLIYADDDAHAAVVAARLQNVASGRVVWLAGGTPAWQAQGLALASAPQRYLPLPQQLVAWSAPRAATLAPADASRRATHTHVHAAAQLAPVALHAQTAALAVGVR